MEWKPIHTAPTTGEYILVGFSGWDSFVAFIARANGKDTYNPGYAKPEVWTRIIPPTKP